MASGNPALQIDTFRNEAETYHGPAVMTVHGTVMKSGILAALLVVAAGVGFVVCHPETSSAVASPEMKLVVLIGGAVGGLLCAIALFFSQRLAPFLAPIYALFEGVFIGGISSHYSQRWHGIIPQAALLTMGILVVMLFAYSTRVIRATPALTKGIIIATGSICLVYLVSMILQMCGIGVPYIHNSGPIGIGFSVLVVGIAAFNFILDFDLIEQGARTGAPKYMEWYAAYGLMVTLVWLYLEVLRLLSKIRGND